MPKAKPPKEDETLNQNADLLLKISQNLQSLKNQPDKDINKRFLQQVILLAEVVGSLNKKLKPGP